jgi:hypothetical protein
VLQYIVQNKYRLGREYIYIIIKLKTPFLSLNANNGIGGLGVSNLATVVLGLLGLFHFLAEGRMAA